MAKYIIKRILLMLLTFFVIISICFFLIKLLPQVQMPSAGKDWGLVLARREAMGYNKPLVEQYFIFLQKSLIGQDWGLGEQMYIAQEVSEVFASKVPATVLVNLYSLLFSIPIGIGLGIFAALKKNKWQDHVISIVIMLFVSVPSYVYAFLTQYILSFKLGWLPFLMKAGTDWFSPEMFKSMIPAILALSFSVVAGLARYTRAELTEVLTSDFMLLARTKGLTKPQATLRHAMRNSMVPIFPMILGEFLLIMSGSLIIEQIFGVPGVGKLYLQSISMRDYNFFLALSAFYTIIGLAAGLVIDLSYGIIDPRIRMGAKK